jgi:hypothetical protein
MSPPRLTSRQHNLIRDVACTVPSVCRSNFLRRIIRHLPQRPTDDDVLHIIRLTYDAVPFLFPSAEQTE